MFFTMYILPCNHYKKSTKNHYFLKFFCAILPSNKTGYKLFLFYIQLTIFKQ